jgi:hypothetical protein
MTEEERSLERAKNALGECHRNFGPSWNSILDSRSLPMYLSFVVCILLNREREREKETCTYMERENLCARE